MCARACMLVRVHAYVRGCVCERLCVRVCVLCTCLIVSACMHAHALLTVYVSSGDSEWSCLISCAFCSGLISCQHCVDSSSSRVTKDQSICSANNSVKIFEQWAALNKNKMNQFVSYLPYTTHTHMHAQAHTHKYIRLVYCAASRRCQQWLQCAPLPSAATATSNEH